MKALILVGGHGTRLRPLTFTKPKPLVPFLNMPVVMHQIKALSKVGVTDVVLAVSFDPSEMEKELSPYCKEVGVKLHFSLELTPLGTAGPIALAKDILTKDNNEMFFVLNSDVTANFPFAQMIKKFKELGKEGVIVGKKVKDPSRFGVIVHDKDYRIEKFVEKPKEFVGDLINAGMYLFSTKMIKRIPYNVKTSIERVTFPQMAKEGELYCLPYEEFWMDIGKPVSFLDGMVLLFDNLSEEQLNEMKNDKGIKRDCVITRPETVMIDKTAKIGKGSVIGPYVSIGANVEIGEGVKIEHSTIMEGSKIMNYSCVKDSIVGWNCTINKWCKVMGYSILGKGVVIREEVFAKGVTVCPFKAVAENVFEPKIIL